ncbi:hypothetical protein DPEC_G00021630 [Dallia pectoralis]|uniref:Uncharacterized protein n=1 Tax=Dallia pectoralis TaxID=75939 RepID=A0ACC2HGK8_DALPE|nr:hypothetical protein DPEC_G00021630 [Dallia pectoralis]
MNWSGIIQSCLAMLHLSQILCHGSVRISIPEELGAGERVGSIGSTFPPPYRLLAEDYIRIDKNTGHVYTTNHRLDREVLCPDQWEGECVVPDGTLAFVGPEETVVKLTVVVEDINDNAPVFDNTDIHKSVPENVDVGTSFLLDSQAVDSDTGRNGQLQYHLEGALGFFTVKVEDSDGIDVLLLLVQKPLDRETSDLHNMTLVVTDGGAVPQNATATLSVEVTDEDDNCPEFSPDGPQRVNITVGVRRGTAVATVRAADRDLGINAAITYILSPRVSDRARELFTLDSQTGLISLRVDLHGDMVGDVEDEVLLRVLASDLRGRCTPADTQVTVSLLPVPQLGIKIKFLAERQDQAIMLRENQPPTVLAILELPGDTSRFEGSSALSIEGEESFSLRLHNGKYLLSTLGPLDYEKKSEYRVTVVMLAGVGENKSQGYFRREIRVLVVDVNDNAPRFLQDRYHLDVEENNPSGSPLLTVKAMDADGQQNSRITYQLAPTSPNEVAAIFRIDGVTGQLTTRKSLDREQQDSHTLTVLAIDSGSPPLESTATVTIRVLDQNDNAPLFLTPHFFFFITENISPLSQIGTVGVSDADAGPNGEVEVRVLNGSAGLFAVDNVRGTLRCTGSLDRERQGRYELYLLATDSGRPSPLTSIARVTVLIEDVNDNQPKVILPSSNLSCLTVSTATGVSEPLTKIYATDEDSGLNSEIRYIIVEPNPPEWSSYDSARSPFQIDAQTGTVTLAQRLADKDRGMHHLFIVVSDRGKPEPLHTTIWVNLLVSDTLEPCHIDTTPTPLPYTLPKKATKLPDCNGESDKGWLFFLIGLGMMGASLCMLLGTLVLYFKQRKPSRRNNIPLHKQEQKYSGEVL